MTQARILDGKRIADDALHVMKAEVDARIAEGKRRPGLAVVLVGDDAASQSYVRNKRRAAGIVGIKTFDHNLADTTEDELLTLIDQLNADLDPLKSFVLPGGSPAAAHLHLARTVARRAERGPSPGNFDNSAISRSISGPAEAAK